jgi:hypothetical protein
MCDPSYRIITEPLLAGIASIRTQTEFGYETDESCNSPTSRTTFQPIFQPSVKDNNNLILLARL